MDLAFVSPRPRPRSGSATELRSRSSQAQRYDQRSATGHQAVYVKLPRHAASAAAPPYAIFLVALPGLPILSAAKTAPPHQRSCTLQYKHRVRMGSCRGDLGTMKHRYALGIVLLVLLAAVTS